MLYRLPAMLAVLVGSSAAFAGEPHFIGSAFTVQRDGDTLVVCAKEAGLGDEQQIHVVLTATAQCVNPGGNEPAAANKESKTAEGDFPVQNGKANYCITVSAEISPDCVPPMSLLWTDVTLTDQTNSLTQSFAGAF